MKLLTQNEIYRYCVELYKDMTQQELADHLWIHRVTLSNILNNKEVWPNLIARLSASKKIKKIKKPVLNQLLYNVKYQKLRHLVRQLIKLDKEQWVDDCIYDLPSLWENK